MVTPISNPLDLEQALLAQLRSGQQAMAMWRGGELAVTAVPGSGKSTGMAAAAALVIAREALQTQRYLLLVTFTRSAVMNLKVKVRQNLQRLGLPPQGFQVHTLHGLALQIASSQAIASGIDWERSTLVNKPNSSHRLIQATVEQWWNDYPDLVTQLVAGRISLEGEETERLRRQLMLRTEILPHLITTIVHEAKSSGLAPEDLWAWAEQRGETQPYPPTKEWPYPLLRMAAGLYDRYEQQLRRSGFADYDDMILGALRVLDDPKLRRDWQQQVFAVFEDEAQDSSPLQSRLITLLAQDPDDPDRPPNLVRVGDPNQAINSTFTPADPIFFRHFCDRCAQQGRLVTMDQAGRSTPRIMTAANEMLTWVNHWITPPTLPVALPYPFYTQAIRGVDPGDPQPDANPPPTGAGVEIQFPDNIPASLQQLRQRIETLVHQDPDFQGAILVRNNRQVQFLAQQLQDWAEALGLPIYDVGSRHSQSQLPRELLTLLRFMLRPQDAPALRGAIQVLQHRQVLPKADLTALLSQPECFLYPTVLQDPPQGVAAQAQALCTKLLRARRELPPLALIAFLGLTLAYDQGELARADQVAELCGQRIQDDRSLQGLVQVLQELLDTENLNLIDPEDQDSRLMALNQLTIVTMHKAKGLDWNYVFLPFLQEAVIPGKIWVSSHCKFLGSFDLAEIIRAEIRQRLHHHAVSQYASQPLVQVGVDQTWRAADYLKRSEDYRLLYVAMTRAKRLLWMAAECRSPFKWHNPLSEADQEQEPCPVLPHLQQILGLDYPG